MEFDPTKEYGNYIEIVPPGKKPILGGGFAVLSGVPWDDASIDFAEKSCEVDSRQWIPKKYRDKIEIIKLSPDMDSDDPFLKVGTVGWKYKPLQKGN